MDTRCETGRGHKGLLKSPWIPRRDRRRHREGKQTRCYLVGRMSKKDTLARQLEHELEGSSLQVLVYDQEQKAADTLGLNSSFFADQIP